MELVAVRLHRGSPREGRLGASAWRRLVVVVVGLAFLLLAGRASAATSVVSFDNLAAGMFVTTQYDSSAGVQFHDPNGSPGTNGYLPHVDSAPAQAHSSPNVADISSCQGGCGEFAFEPRTIGYLTTYATSISVYVGNLPPMPPDGNTAGVELMAFDPNGQQVGTTASTTVTEGAAFTKLTVISPSGQANIAKFQIDAPAPADNGKPIAIDDLSITRPDTPPPPDFTLSTTIPAVSMIAGDAANVPIDVNRANGSNGNVSLSVAGLPTGVTATLSPNPVTGTGASSTMAIASRTDAPASDTNLTITATPGARRGRWASTSTSP